MDDRTRLALRLSYDLAGVTDRRTYLDAMIEALAGVFDVDSNGWVGMDAAAGRFESLGTNAAGDPSVAPGLKRMKDAHPMMISYLSRPGDMSPRRISDIIGDREWLLHPVYLEMFIPLGARREMTIVVGPATPTRWDGFGFHRAHRDFTDDELDIARAVQPLLVALNRLTEVGTAPDLPQEQRLLSPRQAQILQLMAQGFRAADIALILRISPATVRKHVEHVYEKLGEHNRVRAMNAAARAGLIAR